MGGVFFFKQKTAYEMRISDWSSDVCSSDLAGQRVELVHAGDQPVALADIGRGRGLGGDPHFDRIAQMGLRDALDRRWHGRREQRDLTRVRRGLEDGFDVLDETHLQHFVGFVEHQRSEEHTYDLQSLMRNSYAVFCLN